MTPKQYGFVGRLHVASGSWRRAMTLGWLVLALSGMAYAQSPEPILLNPIAPFYPWAAFEAKREGAVRIGFDIDANGKTINVRVLEATPPRMFNDAALSLVIRSHYGTVENGVAMQPLTGMTRLIEFKLADALLAPKMLKDGVQIPPLSLDGAEFVGFCAVDFMVQTDGSATDIKVTRAEPYDRLDEVCRRNIERAKFSPALYRGKPVAVLTYNQGIARLRRDPHFYLKPGQWVTLDYTLRRDGYTADVELVEASDEHININDAIKQLKEIHFAPMIENGQPVEKRHQRISIGKIETGIPPFSQW